MKFCVYLLLLGLHWALVLGDENLYNVLGVRKSASPQEIKKAYKKLAREWHPDKNDDPEAGDRFIKINEAYETLSDPEKKDQYDKFGTSSAQANTGGGPRGFHSPFDAFFADGPHGFSFGAGGRESSVGRHAVTLSIYDSKIFPESGEKPYLLYAYTDFCYRCMQVDLIWDRIVHDMETIGMGVGTVHAQFEHGLIHRLKISSVPYIVMVFNRRLSYYSGEIRVQPIRDFVRSVLPTDLVAQVTNSNYQQFLDGWADNHVRMLFFGDRKSPTLRYMLAAHTFKSKAAAGYVNLLSPDTSDIRKRYSIQSNTESLLIFNENTDSPEAHISMKQLLRSTMDKVIESNQFLVLPRLSSQNVFNSLCPPYSSIRKKSLCVLLLSRNIPEHETYRSHFRQYAQEHPDSEGRVKYAYVYEDTQTSFVKALTRGHGAINETMGTLRVAVLWRKNERKLNYDWLEDGWHRWSSPDAHRSRRKLHRMIGWILESGDILPNTMEIAHDLQDEHAQALFYRIIQRLSDWCTSGYDKLRDFDEMTVITLGTTVVFLLVIGVFMKTLFTLEEDATATRQRKPKRTKHSEPRQRESSKPTVYLHPLCTDNFEKLIMDSEPGVRLICILVNEECRDKLLQDFAKVIHPYSRSDAFKFAFLQLETYLSWYRHLLEETLDFKRDLGDIKISNCIGTVLAINGTRKYYSIYHAQSKSLRHKANSAGKFMGFEDSDSSSESDPDADKLFTSDLLGTFGIWMDRLCEGTLKRFRVQYWPSMSS